MYKILITAHPQLQQALPLYLSTAKLSLLNADREHFAAVCLREKPDFLLLQAERQACWYMDELIRLYANKVHPFIILFQLGDTVRYAMSNPLMPLPDEMQRIRDGCLHALKRAVEEEQERRQPWQLYFHIDYHSSRFEKTEYLRDILSGVPNEAFWHIVEQNHLDLRRRGHFLLTIETLDNKVYNDYTFNRDVFYFLEELRREEVYRILHAFDGGEMFGANRFTNCILFNAPPDPSLARQERSYRQIVAELYHATRSVYHAHFISGRIGQPCEINEAYRRLARAKKYKVFFPDEPVLSLKQIASSRQPPVFAGIDALLGQIRGFTLQTKPQEWSDALHLLFDGLLKKTVSMTAYYYCRSTLNVLLQEFAAPIQGSFSFSSFQELENAASLDEVEKLYLDGFLYVRERLLDDSQKYDAVIRKVRAYLAENYQRPVTLEDIARHVYLSRVYICKKYRKDTGETLITALTRLRMEKAKELLRQDPVKVYEAAQAVGFQDEKYFSKVFHRYTGVAPREYARLAKKGARGREDPSPAAPPPDN